MVLYRSVFANTVLGILFNDQSVFVWAGRFKTQAKVGYLSAKVLSSNTVSVVKSCNYSRMTQNVKQINLVFSLPD